MNRMTWASMSVSADFGAVLVTGCSDREGSPHIGGQGACVPCSAVIPQATIMRCNEVGLAGQTAFCKLLGCCRQVP